MSSESLLLALSSTKQWNLWAKSKSSITWSRYLLILAPVWFPIKFPGGNKYIFWLVVYIQCRTSVFAWDETPFLEHGIWLSELVEALEHNLRAVKFLLDYSDWDKVD